jgi:hypothetical protein
MPSSVLPAAISLIQARHSCACEESRSLLDANEGDPSTYALIAEERHNLNSLLGDS